MMSTSPIADEAGARGAWNRSAELLTRWIGHDLLALIARASIATVFLQSGRTKVDGVLHVTDGAVLLFRDEYKLPVLSPETAAHLAAYSEHFLPLLLLLGLGTRFAALGLIGMTLVIEIFVYPDAWPTHLSWLAVLLYLLGRGAGRLSLDRMLGIR